MWPLHNKLKNSSSLNGVLAELVINYKKDFVSERRCIPNKYDSISHYASDPDVNRQIEIFLCRNGIDPQTVARAIADESLVIFIFYF
jgi:hypothetical protein